MPKIAQLLDLNHTISANLFQGKTYPWEILGDIGNFLRDLGPTLPKEDFRQIGDDVWIARDARVFPTAHIDGPCIIDREAEVRHGAYIRGSVLVGKKAVVGNSVELKNVVLFDAVQVPHYNYVGDSILGYQAHMGAGSITSNVKSDKSLVVVKTKDKAFPTGRKKVGAILGDGAEIGCNAVLNPGTIIGRQSIIYPTECVRGVIPAGHIYKNKNQLIPRKT